MALFISHFVFNGIHEFASSVNELASSVSLLFVYGFDIGNLWVVLHIGIGLKNSRWNFKR